VEVKFGNTRLKRCYETQKEAVRAWGVKIARRYVDRVNRLHAAASAQDLMGFPELRLHRLKRDRQGEWSMVLDGAYRLIVVLENEKMTIVRVEEVSDHYGD